MDTIDQIRTIISSEETADIDHKLQDVSIDSDRKSRKTEDPIVTTNDENEVIETENSNREERRRRKSDGGPRETTDPIIGPAVSIEYRWWKDIRLYTGLYP